MAAKIWTLTCVFLTAAGLVVNIWLLQEEGSTAPVNEKEQESYIVGSVLVASVVGVVEAKRKDGEWRTLELGSSLSRGDMIRTGDFSQVMLRPTDESTLTISPNTDFTIGEETLTASRYTLNMGRISADIRAEQERIYEFRSGGGEVTADARQGEFQLITDGGGFMGVTTERGEVGLSSEGRRVVVTEGQQAVAMPGSPPKDPLPIPEEVLLEVRWPDAPTEEDVVKVAGRTDVGTRLRLGGKLVPVERDGSFEVEVPMGEGENQFVITAEDGSGNIQRSESPIVVRRVPQPPPLEIRVEGSVWE